MFQAGLPHFAVGPIVKGFGRGSRELRIPTANYPDEVVQNLPKEIATGVYCGFASVNKEEVHKMVMSIGWNPFYENSQKTMETHIMHNFQDDFYGAELRVVMLGYLRPEKKFNSVDDLIAEIRADIDAADALLNDSKFSVYRTNCFFTEDDNDQQKSTEGVQKTRRRGLCNHVESCILS
ncbi:putative riboflavin kinase [Neodiprion virginianus]|uniref:putative riboflavin kinase n=1 Tax=Neodiprion virginianus TaxID=2961670 RepID=UPI001EE69C1A|nr:putative riboflavin kinase [Neodiprion virginianus]